MPEKMSVHFHLNAKYTFHILMAVNDVVAKRETHNGGGVSSNPTRVIQ